MIIYLFTQKRNSHLRKLEILLNFLKPSLIAIKIPMEIHAGDGNQFLQMHKQDMLLRVNSIR